VKIPITAGIVFKQGFEKSEKSLLAPILNPQIGLAKRNPTIRYPSGIFPQFKAIY